MTLATTPASSNGALLVLLNQLSATATGGSSLGGSTLASALVATPSTTSPSAPATLNAPARPALSSDILQLLMRQIETGPVTSTSSVGAPAATGPSSATPAVATDLKSGHGHVHRHHPPNGADGNILAMLATQSPSQLAGNMVSALDMNGTNTPSASDFQGLLSNLGNGSFASASQAYTFAASTSAATAGTTTTAVQA